ncbi:rhomboid-like protein [Gordonia sp. CPCC 205333]|uniref:rhomboid-like protein n=1 Tax=Gordonia sp. CPCC 205333 TaxID=3140790 RepID=UPI003AF3B09D
MYTDVGQRIWTYLRRSPLTFCWLAILLATTIVQHLLSPGALDTVLANRSTNIDHLTSNPFRVIVLSLFWLDGGGGAAYWLPYAVAFAIFLAPAERWLGWRRWLAIGFAGHILATLLSEGTLALAIAHDVADDSMRNTQDVGVSYFLAAIIAVLTFRIARPWRWGYLAGVVACYGVPLLISPTFTALGHFSSVLIGLACYPLARSKMADQWNPMARWRGSSPRP